MSRIVSLCEAETEEAACPHSQQESDGTLLSSCVTAPPRLYVAARVAEEQRGNQETAQGGLGRHMQPYTATVP